ncbi:glycosyltransferase [Terrabacter aeriphilus]|uniref:Glycosyltransferase n=1 Tax=Terrabacter aeriphilus TaxID=515662 RepID=A0ABP9J6S0_9MICO
MRLRHHMASLGAVEWATFDDPQSRSLLAGETVHHVRYIAPRDLAATLSVGRDALRIVRRGRFDLVVSTGSAIAVPFLGAARALGRTSHYVESAARSQGPSVTGRIVSRIPGVRLHTQYSGWSGRRWQPGVSLFDAYVAEDVSEPRSRARRVVVTLGTMRTYEFRSAVDALLATLPEVLAPDAEVLWQVGCTDVSDLPIVARSSVPADEMRQAVETADLVIAHAGVGSALSALDAGLCPVLLPRRAARGEHVDDHQLYIAQALADRSIAVSCGSEELTVEHLSRAMRTAVRSRPQAGRERASTRAGRVAEGEDVVGPAGEACDENMGLGGVE